MIRKKKTSQSSTSSNAPSTERHPQVIYRPDLPTIWADGLRFTSRKTTGVEAVVYSFLQQVEGDDRGPVGMIEVQRITTSADQGRKLIDIMCRMLNHYPEKPAESAPT